MKKTICKAALLATVFSSPLLAAPGDGNYYFFGDSALEMGNLSLALGAEGIQGPPYYQQDGFFRDSNGPVWAEQLGRPVGLALDPNRTAPNVNFAVSGAHMTTLGGSVDLPIPGIGVSSQISYAELLVSGGDLSFGNDDVFFVHAGGNDFLFDLFNFDETAITSSVVTAARDNVERLASLGARTILFSEVPPISRAIPFQGPELAELRGALDEVIGSANDQLGSALRQTSAELGQDVNIVTVKYTDFVDHLFDNAAALGFDNTTEGCFIDGNLCSENQAEQNRYIFFDEEHLTTAAQAVEAAWYQSTLDAALGRSARLAARIPDLALSGLETDTNTFEQYRQAYRHSASSGIQLFGGYIIDEDVRFTGKQNDLDLRSTASGWNAGVLLPLSKDFMAGAGFSRRETVSDASDGSGFELESNTVHGFLEYKASAFAIDLTGSFASLDVSNFSRETGVPLLAAKGDTEGRQWDVGLGISNSGQIGPFKINTRVGGHISRVKLDAFNETGATGLNLSYQKQTVKSERLVSQFEIEGPALNIGEKVSILPVAGGYYRYELSDEGRDFGSQLIDNTAQLALTQTDKPNRQRLDVNAGLEARVNGVNIGARYYRTIDGETQKSDAVRIYLRATF